MHLLCKSDSDCVIEHAFSEYERVEIDIHIESAEDGQNGH